MDSDGSFAEEFQTPAQKAALEELAVAIRDCRICDGKHIQVRHASSTMFRGTGRLGIVVGIQPGQTEVASGRAFSGPAGTRLIKWLIKAGIGNDRESIFERMYFTSLAKCGSAPQDTNLLIGNCRPYLAKQIGILSPRVLITLGADPLQNLFENSRFDDWVGRLVNEQEIDPTLFPLLPSASKILALPHPSPLSRWLNESENQKKLDAALQALKDFIR